MQTWRRVPAGVWLLGIVSLLMDISSEVVASLLPLHLTRNLMLPVAAVGLLEGLAVATAAVTKIFAGALSDRWRNRKWLAVLGYGLSAASRPLFPLALHAAYGLTSYPAGAWSDRVGRRRVLVAGTLVLVCTHLTFAAGATPMHVWIGVALWGVHMGLTQGVLASLLADVTPPHLRGSAFGVASFITGMVMFAGNAASGAIWQWRGAEALFLTAAAVSFVAAAALSLWRPAATSAV